MLGDFNFAPLIVVLAAVLLFLVVRRWDRLGMRSCEPAVEVIIVNATAALLAHQRGKTAIGGPEFVLAALANPDVVASFERSGASVAKLRRSLASGEAATDAPDEVQAMAWNAELRAAFKRATEKALERREPEFLLVDVLAALKDGDDEVATLLRNSGVSFDDTLVATVADGDVAAFAYVHNDAVSPQPKVAQVLREVFDLGEPEAVYTMLTVHYRGRAALGPYNGAEAEARVERARARAAELGLAELVIGTEPPDTSEWRMTSAHGLLP